MGSATPSHFGEASQLGCSGRPCLRSLGGWLRLEPIEAQFGLHSRYVLRVTLVFVAHQFPEQGGDDVVPIWHIAPLWPGGAPLRHPTQPMSGLRLEGRGNQSGAGDDRVRLRVPSECEGEVPPHHDPHLKVRREHPIVDADRGAALSKSRSSSNRARGTAKGLVPGVGPLRQLRTA